MFMPVNSKENWANRKETEQARNVNSEKSPDGGTPPYIKILECGRG